MWGRRDGRETLQGKEERRRRVFRVPRMALFLVRSHSLLIRGGRGQATGNIEEAKVNGIAFIDF